MIPWRSDTSIVQPVHSRAIPHEKKQPNGCCEQLVSSVHPEHGNPWILNGSRNFIVVSGRGGLNGPLMSTRARQTRFFSRQSAGTKAARIAKIASWGEKAPAAKLAKSAAREYPRSISASFLIGPDSRPSSRVPASRRTTAIPDRDTRVFNTLRKFPSIRATLRWVVIFSRAAGKVGLQGVSSGGNESKCCEMQDVKWTLND